jgi:CRISPR-associated protein Cmr4
MLTQLYIITAKTHLHVGSGNTNAGVIDNLVQRDPADNLPCIFASSLKGAFREFFEEGPDKSITKPLADLIFGAGINKQSNGNNAKGTHIFHQASLLSIPARSNVKPFFNAICPAILEKFKEDAASFGININVIHTEIDSVLSEKNVNDMIDVFTSMIPDLKIEDYTQSFNFRPLEIPHMKKVFGNNLILMTDEDFADLCNDYSLPVIARNNLENGQSKNLWYEQIVPRQARFYFLTARQNTEDNFDTKVDKKSVQIGANASIGYGMCLVNNLQTQLL